MPRRSDDIGAPSSVHAPVPSVPGMVVVSAIPLPEQRAVSIGVPRDQILGPICPTAEATDQVLFEDAANPALKLYLPRYRLKLQNDQYQMIMEHSGQDWTLTVHLEKYPAAEIAQAATSASELPHAVGVSLAYHSPVAGPSSGPRELPFQEVTGEGSGLRAVLRVSTLIERDQLYQALTEPTYSAVLLIRRTATFAASVGSASAGTSALPPSPEAIAISDIANLRLRDLLRRAQALHMLLQEIIQGQIAQPGPLNRLNDLNNGVVDLWGTLAGYGLGDDPYHDHIQVSSSGFISGKGTPDFGIPGPYTALGLPRLYERFLQQTGVAQPAAQAQADQLNSILAPYANAAVFPFRDFGDRAYNSYREGKDIGSPQYNADLSGLDQWLINLEAVLARISSYFALAAATLPPQQVAAELDTLREIVTLRCRDVLRRTQNLHMLLHEIMQGQVGPVQPLNRLNDVNNDLFDLWLTLAGYGIGDDPYHDNIQASNSGFSRGKDTPDFGISGSYTALGLPHLYERLLQISSITSELYRTLDERFAAIVAPAANPAVYPHRDFYERAYSAYREGKDIGTPQYNVDLSTIDRWLSDLETALNQAPQQFVPQPAPSAVQLFLQASHTLDRAAEPDPFVFLPALHSYIFQDLDHGDSQALRRRQVGEHIYYQDQSRAHVFYYLPDSFKIGREAAAPRRPLMSVRVTGADASLQNSQVVVEYIALPVVDVSRLTRDTPALRDLAGVLPPNVDAPVLQVLLLDAGQAHLRLALPGPNGTIIFQARDSTQISATGRLSDSLTLALPDFQAVYDALMGGSLTLFQGQVEITLDAQHGEVAPAIPFIARMSDLFGELLEYQIVPDAATGRLLVRLRNAIESPLQINRLEVGLWSGSVNIPAQISDFAPGMTLGAGQEITVMLTPSAPLSGADALRIVFDLSGLQVLPDRARIWDAILDPSSPSQFSQKIRVCTIPKTFDTQVENPVVALIVNFEHGDTIRLDPGNLEIEANVRQPLISDWILDKANTGQYRYRLTIIHTSGAAIEDNDWRSDDRTILYPSVSP